MKIAIYKNTDLDYEAVFEVSDYIEGDDERIRLSDIIEVDFPMLDKSETVQAEVDAIDKQIQTVQAAAHIKTSELEQRKAELLALPDLSEQ